MSRPLGPVWGERVTLLHGRGSSWRDWERMSGVTSRLFLRARQLPTHSWPPPLAVAGELARGWGDARCGGARRRGASRGGGARPAAPAVASAAGPRPGPARRGGRWAGAARLAAPGGGGAAGRSPRVFARGWRPLGGAENFRRLQPPSPLASLAASLQAGNALCVFFRILKRKEAPGRHCLSGIGVDACIGVQGARVSPFQAGPPSS